jgi:hypothetical protein
MEQWVAVREWMLPAIAETNGTHTEEDVVALLLMGKLRLWVGKSYGALTEFVTYPQFKVLNIFLVGGAQQLALSDLWSDHPALVEYARANGCKRITLGGREGWSRTPSDWSKGGVFMYKDL